MTSGWPEDRRDLRRPSGENDDTAAEARARGRLATQTGPQNPVSHDASGFGAAHPSGPLPVGSLPHPSGPLPVGPMPPSRGRFGRGRSRDDQVEVAPSDADYDWFRYLGEAGPAQGAAPSGRGTAGTARPDRQADTNPRAASRPAVTDPLAGTARPAVTNWPAVTDRPAVTDWPVTTNRSGTDWPGSDGPAVTGRHVTHRRGTDPSIADSSITDRPVTGRHVTHRRGTDPSITDPSITDPSITDPSVTDRPVTGRHVTHRRVTDPSVTDRPGAVGWPGTARPVADRPDVTGRQVSDRRISHRRGDDPGRADGAPRQAAGPGAATAFMPPTPTRERPGPAQPEPASGPWPTERGWSPSRRPETAPRGADALTRPVGGSSARPAERPFVRPDERPAVREAERSSGPAAWPVDNRPRRPGQTGLGHQRLTAAIDTGPETARSALEPGQQSLRGRRGARRQLPAAYADPMDASGPIQTIAKDPAVAAAPALTKRAARARARRRHRTLLRVIGLVVAVAIVPATAAAVLRSGLLRSGGPQHTISIPAKMLGYTEEPALAKGMDAPALRADIVKKGNGEASHVVDGVYEDNASTGTKSSPLIILFIGGNLSGSATSFIASFTGMVPGAFATSAGKLGGQAACVPGTAGRPAECAWADNDTFGLFASPTLSASALGAELRAMRPLVEHQHKGG